MIEGKKMKAKRWRQNDEGKIIISVFLCTSFCPHDFARRIEAILRVSGFGLGIS